MMLEMTKAVASRPKLSTIASVLLPISVVCALLVGLVIGLCAMWRSNVAMTVDLPVEVSGIRSKAPEMSKMFESEKESLRDRTVEMVIL